MRMILIAVAWTIITVIIYALAGCGEVTATKEGGGFWCLGVCAQKSVAVEVEAKGRGKQ
jgi:hypothetical protein